MPRGKLFSTAAVFLLPFLLFAQKDAVKIPWGTPLAWANFKAAPDASSPYLASTYSGFSFSYSYKAENDKPELHYVVKTNFYPDRSWVKPGHATDKLLRHEQLHFDISELFARKFRKYLAEHHLELPKRQREIKQKAHFFERQRQQAEKQYDRETKHGTLPKNQVEWEKEIKTELKDLEKFKTKKN